MWASSTQVVSTHINLYLSLLIFKMGITISLLQRTVVKLEWKHTKKQAQCLAYGENSVRVRCDYYSYYYETLDHWYAHRAVKLRDNELGNSGEKSY